MRDRIREHGFGVRVASRRADRSHPLLDDVQLRWIQADVHDERSLADALAGAYGAVNAVSLYVEHGRETFHSVHVEAAEQGRRSRRNEPASSGWSMFQGSVPIPAPNRFIFASVARGRIGSPGSVRRRASHPSRRDVWARRRSPHDGYQAPRTTPNLSDVWPRSNATAASLC